MVTATMFTVIWNWINFLMESQMFLPHITAFTMELKLSSRRIIAAAYRATSVPEIPIAKPTSAFFKAGASLVPSPVTATTSPLSFKPVTKAYLSSGRDRAKTNNLSLMLSKDSLFLIVSTLISFPVSSAYFAFLAQSQVYVLHFLQTTPPINCANSVPSITKLSSSALMMPTSLAIARAVMMLSPVTILTLIPALWHFAIAPGTSFRGMSLTPKMQSRISPFFSILKTPFSSLELTSYPEHTFLYAKQRVLSDDSAIFLMFSCILSLIESEIMSILLFCMSYHLLQQVRTISDAPFTKIYCSEPREAIMDILLREELKGYFKKVGYFSRQSAQFTPDFYINFSKAISVEDPFYSGRRFAVLFTHVPIFKSYSHSLFFVKSSKLNFYLWLSMLMADPFHISVRVILFIVRVPVLSEQMLLAPPMVSQASIFRTKLLSVSICLTETARERVTERGRPSGMATTITVIERMKQLMSSLRSTEVFHSLLIPFSIANRTKRIRRMRIAEYSPNLPMSDATFQSFDCNGVWISSY